MKLKVLQPFHDRYTDELYLEGDVIDVSEERGEEILSVPFLVSKQEDVQDVAKPKATRKKTTKKKD